MGTRVAAGYRRHRTPSGGHGRPPPDDGDGGDKSDGDGDDTPPPPGPPPPSGPSEQHSGDVASWKMYISLLCTIFARVKHKLLQEYFLE